MKKMLMALMFLAVVGGVEARNEKKKHKKQQSTQQKSTPQQTKDCAISLGRWADKSYPSVDLSQVNTTTANWVIRTAKNITSCPNFKNSAKLAKRFLVDNRQYFVSQQSDQDAGSYDLGEQVNY